MKNVWVICRKELRSYFASPIAYAVMALFALIFGLVFFIATRDFVNMTFRSQMMGGAPPPNVNEFIIRPYLGLILQGGCLLGLGALISAMTSNQIVAGGAAFFFSLLLYMLSWFTEYDSTNTSKVLNYVSIVTHMENFSKGILDLKDAIFYITFIFLVLFLTQRQMESVRWRS